MTAAPLPPLLLKGDCLVELARVPDNSVDAVVTDPPYGLEFMGKAWDSFAGEVWQAGAGFKGGGTSATKNAPSFSSEPNGTCAKCGGRMRGAKSCSCAEPDFRVKGEPVRKGGSNHAAMLAFELWTMQWATECYRILKPGGHMLAFGGSRTWHRLAAGIEDAGFEIRDSIAWLYGSGFPKSMDVSKAIDKAAGATREVTGRARGASSDRTESLGRFAPEYDATLPATDAAREWEGWGTALKPAFEPIVVGRKPLGEKTVAANVLRHGTGALNIDATRIAGNVDEMRGRSGTSETPGGETSSYRAHNASGGVWEPQAAGRWPANVILDESQAAALDAQTGTKMSRGHTPKARKGAATDAVYALGHAGQDAVTEAHAEESGGASRFFYVAKAPKSERPIVDGTAHPTVKPLALMRYLCRLACRPGGVIVDPFAGSGTTGEAAYLEGFESIIVEMTPDYWPLIDARIARVTGNDNNDDEGAAA